MFFKIDSSGMSNQIDLLFSLYACAPLLYVCLSMPCSASFLQLLFGPVAFSPYLPLHSCLASVCGVVCVSVCVWGVRGFVRSRECWCALCSHASYHTRTRPSPSSMTRQMPGARFSMFKKHVSLLPPHLSPSDAFLHYPSLCFGGT